MGQINIGVNNIARNVKNVFIGVDGVARAVKNIYIGDANGKAKLCWSSSLNRVTNYLGKTQIGTITDTNGIIFMGKIKQVSDNHFLVTTYSYLDLETSTRCNYLFNVYLNEDGSIKSYTKLLINYESYSSQTTSILDLAIVNNNIGACLSTFNYDKNLVVFDLNNSTSILSQVNITTDSTDYNISLVPLGNDTIMYAYYNSSGYVYAKIYQYVNGQLTLKYYDCISRIYPTVSQSLYNTYRPCVLHLSNNRFCTICYTQSYTVFCFYEYDYDSNGTLSVTLQKISTSPYFIINSYISLDNDTFMLINNYNYLYSLHVNSDNSYVVSSSISNQNTSSVRIGNSNSILSLAFNNNTSIQYINSKTNVFEQTYSDTNVINGICCPYGNNNVLNVECSSSNLIFNKLSFS